MPGYFVNDIHNCVDDSLIGYVRAYNHLELIGRSVISRAQIPSVALISGNGSGHEPAMVGFVGRGMLSACISGSIFASPPSLDILKLIMDVKRRGAKQILLLILNYTGDRLNFGLAMERARELGIDIDMLVIADDAAVENIIGPRGLAGALLVIKVAGALAEQGKTMSEIVDTCQEVRSHLRTIGLSASGVRAPGQQQSFELLDDEVELGMGIHGEPGAQRCKLLSSRHCTDLACGHMFLGSRALTIQREDHVLLFVNNLGGCSNLELGIIVKDAIESLESRGLHVKRVICGTMVTSLNMKGFSLTVLKLMSDMSTAILNLLDAPTEAFAWPKSIHATQALTSIHPLTNSAALPDDFVLQHGPNDSKFKFDPLTAGLVNQALVNVVKRLHQATDKLNKLDAVSGDGDTGTSFSRVADTIERDLNDGKLAFDRPANILRRLGFIAESRMGGTCGAICGLFLASTATRLSAASTSSHIIENFGHALEAGVQTVESYARVRPGDKSLLDAIFPAVDFIKSKAAQLSFSGQDWKELAAIVDHAAEQTKSLTAKVGRAAYTKSVNAEFVDPGAYAVSVIFQALSDAFNNHGSH